MRKIFDVAVPFHEVCTTLFAAASEVALRFFFFFGLFRFFFVLSPGEAVWAPGPPAAGGGPSRFSKGMLNATDVFGNGRTRVGVEGFGVDTDTPFVLWLSEISKYGLG